MADTAYTAAILYRDGTWSPASVQRPDDAMDFGAKVAIHPRSRRYLQDCGYMLHPDARAEWATMLRDQRGHWHAAWAYRRSPANRPLID